MLFRPTFCAHCGEKIERTEWGIFTSRRFCPVCESEFKGPDLIPRVIVGLGIFVGLFGFGSYLKSGSAASDSAGVRQPRKFLDQTPTTQVTTANLVSAPPPEGQKIIPTANLPQAPTLSAAGQKPKIAIDEPLYYCGATTKKGTPCSRRVKGNVRCFQHVGMPAVLPAEKLKIGAR